MNALRLNQLNLHTHVHTHTYQLSHKRPLIKFAKFNYELNGFKLNLLSLIAKGTIFNSFHSYQSPMIQFSIKLIN